MRCERESVDVVCPPVSRAVFNEQSGVSVRYVGLDVHRDFCEIAILEHGALAACGRVATTPEALELFASSLTTDDQAALEVTGNAWEIARILEPHVARVVVVNPSDTGIAQARAKTDRLDARALARLLAIGELDSVWMPDERIRVLSAEVNAAAGRPGAVLDDRLSIACGKGAFRPLRVQRAGRAAMDTADLPDPGIAMRESVVDDGSGSAPGDELDVDAQRRPRVAVRRNQVAAALGQRDRPHPLDELLGFRR